jgi:predicted nucleotidyltransferase
MLIPFSGIYFPEMRTNAPALLPLFRSEMQVRLLGLLLLQPERSWTLEELVDALDAPQSSVHRELGRAVDAGIVSRDATARPFRFRAATDEPLNEPLATLLRRSVGVEEELRRALDRAGVSAAAIHGSWVRGTRRPGSDVDVVVIGDADLRELRRAVRPVGQMSGRTIDLTLLSEEEFRELTAERSSFARRLLEAPTTPLVGDLASFATR